MKRLNKKAVFLTTICLAVVVVLIATAFSNRVIKLNYEIDIDKVLIDVDYSTQVARPGIQCGSVYIELGQVIDITPYTITKELDKDGVKIMQLLAPSKKYELVTVGYEGLWHVQEIRTTVPTVMSSYGFAIGDDKSAVKSLVKIPNKKKLTIKEDNAEVRLEFISDILCVMDLRCK